MTANQVSAIVAQEQKRANIAKEAENYRSNLEKERENRRSNQVKEAETERSNRAKEEETHRSNSVNEKIGAVKLGADYANAAGNILKGAGSIGKLFG